MELTGLSDLLGSLERDPRYEYGNLLPFRKPVDGGPVEWGLGYSGLLKGLADAALMPGKALHGEASEEDAVNFALALLGSGAAAGSAPAGSLGMNAFHGSPHRFNKFSMSKIGTGEGAQAYGHGLYFAESPTVAKTYQGKVAAMKGDSATIDGRPVDWDNPKEYAAFELWRHNGDAEAAAQFAESTFKNKEAAQILRSGRALPKVDTAGSLYHVDIPDSAIDNMLDWDKPLSEQPESVRKVVGDLVGDMLPVSDGHWWDLAHRSSGARAGFAFESKDAAENAASSMTGSDVYKILSKKMGGDKSASKLLHKNGIPGIKYLDQGSRSAGKGTRNLVVFDENLPKIIKRE